MKKYSFLAETHVFLEKQNLIQNLESSNFNASDVYEFKSKFQ